MKKYRYIKELVTEETKKLNGTFPDKEYLDRLVKENFPNSKWQDTHYAWYKSQINTGRITLNETINESNDLNVTNENETKEFSLSLEKDLKIYLSMNLNEIEDGLELINNGIEYKTSTGYIDLLAKDKNGDLVVIELKAGKGKDAVIGQILGYMGALHEEDEDQSIRGIIIASDFEKRVLYATKQMNNLKLMKYALNFDFTQL